MRPNDGNDAARVHAPGRTGQARRVHAAKCAVAIALTGVMALSGCGQVQNQGRVTTNAASDVERVIASSYRADIKTVYLTVARPNSKLERASSGTGTSENLINANDPEAFANYATAMYPRQLVRAVHVVFAGRSAGGAASVAAAAAGQVVETNHGWVAYHAAPRQKSPVLGRLRTGDKAVLVRRMNRWWYEIHWKGKNVYITANRKYTHVAAATAATTPSRTISVPSTIQQPVSQSAASAASALNTSGTARIKLPPPGTHWASIKPKAGRNATVQAKTNAVLSVAKSKLGTPYIWGHNEDRGQRGFDCSNFTEYVYRHALGYRFTTSSRGQYRYVGRTIPRSQMKPGDLLIFEKGKHVGIYAGNNRMIQEGGGLGKVGYLSVGQRSYWGRHISAIRRMY